jgi:hypothetical protein
MQSTSNPPPGRIPVRPKEEQNSPERWRQSRVSFHRPCSDAALTRRSTHPGQIPDAAQEYPHTPDLNKYPFRCPCRFCSHAECRGFPCFWLLEVSKLVNLDTRQRPVQHPAPSADADIAGIRSRVLPQPRHPTSRKVCIRVSYRCCSRQRPGVCHLGSLLHAKVSDYCQLYQR